MTAKPIITIFAGFGMPDDPAVIEAAKILGTKVGLAGYDLVYGASKEGVMGVVAKAAQDAGSHVTAVVLKKYENEAQLDGVTLVCVETEQDRFRELTTYKNPVAFFALPGGPGTLREIAQAMENAVYENGQSVILVMVGKYFDGLLDCYKQAAENGLMNTQKLEKLKRWSVEDPLSAVLPAQSPAAIPAKTSSPSKKS